MGASYHPIPPQLGVDRRVYHPTLVYLLGKSLDIRGHVTSPCCTFLYSRRSRKERMPMMHHPYRERDYAFGQVMMTLRTAMNLTQVELAQSLGVSRGAVLGWEAGSSYPKAKSL